ncbi:YybS family protein [Clostridiaceae bacterium UIB06]|nr:YybS family protein [Clostridiaceae bacterium UIB06]
MQNRIYNTKAIIEAGLISALIVIIMLLNVYMPIFSVFGTFILPVPITMLYIRHNYKVTLSAVVVSGILIGMLYDPISALTASILFGSTGIALGYCIKHDIKFSKTILYLAIASVLAIIVKFVLIFSFVYTEGIIQFFNQNIKLLNESFNVSKDLYIKMGIPNDQIANLEKMTSMFTVDYVLRLIPATIIIISFISAYLNYVITRAILKKLRYTIKEPKPFTEIYINTRIGTIVVLILIVGILLNKNKIEIGEYITSSSGFVLQIIFLLDGLAVACYYLKNKFKMSKMVIVLILVFTATSPISIIYMYLGFIDMIIDFRKLDPYRRLIKE